MPDPTEIIPSPVDVFADLCAITGDPCLARAILALVIAQEKAELKKLKAGGS